MRRDLLLAVSFGAFFALVLPLQTYLGNGSAYPFGLGRLLLEGFALAAALTAAVFALLRFGGRTAPYLGAFFTALLVCGYLETGPLSFGLPELSGDLPDSLAAAGRKAWDGAVWTVLVLGFVAAAKAVRRGIALIASSVLVLGFASLFDVRPEETASDEPGGGGYEMSVDIINAVEYSPTRNVLLFVLDNVDTFVAADLVRRDPALAEKFPGFTAFRNNVGMHDSTKLGVPGIMTGRYFEPGRGALVNYIMSVFGPDSFLADYKAHGDAIYAMFCTCSYGFTTAEIPPERQRVKAESSGPVFCRKTAEVPYLCLGDVLAFRILPFAFKRQFLATKLRHRETVWRVDQAYDHEQTVFPVLAAAPVADDPRQMFAKFHTHGGHPPFLFGADDYRTAVARALERLGTLFDVLRGKGVYDTAFIVVAADHGAQQTGRADEPLKSAAMLWVKPEGDRMPFAVSDVPTSHAKIAPLMRTVCTHRLDRGEIAALLRTEERFYRQRDRGDRHGCFDWIVPADRKAVRK